MNEPSSRCPAHAGAGFSLIEILLALALLAMAMLASARLVVAARSALERAAAAARGQQAASGAISAVRGLPPGHPLWSGERLAVFSAAAGASLEVIAQPWEGQQGLRAVLVTSRLRAGAGRDEITRLWSCVRAADLR